MIAARINLFLSLAFAICNVQAAIPHTILKSDYNGDGTADRIVFARKGISGFFQSTTSNKIADVFYIEKENRSILYFGVKEFGGPFLMLEDNLGLYKTVSFFILVSKTFKLQSSYLVPNKVYFLSQDSCPGNVVDLGAHTKYLQLMSDIKSKAIGQLIESKFDPSCKSIFGKDYQNLTEGIAVACGMRNGKSETNNLISCLDSRDSTKMLASIFKTKLASNIYDGFKISCAKSNSTAPLASFDSSSKQFSFYRISSPTIKRDFELEFFHEMMHSCNLSSEKSIDELVKHCAIIKTEGEIGETAPSIPTNEFHRLQDVAKSGTVINLPTQNIPSSTVDSAIVVGQQGFNSNFSTEDPVQMDQYVDAGNRVANAFGPTFNAAAAAISSPAYAATQRTNENTFKATSPIGNENIVNEISLPAGGSPSVVTPSVSNRSALSEATAQSPQGAAGRSPSSETSSAGRDAIKARAVGNAGTSPQGSADGTRSPASINVQTSSKTTPEEKRELELTANVPILRNREAFTNALKSPRYADQKAALLNPENFNFMNQIGIQYQKTVIKPGQKATIKIPPNEPVIREIYVDNGTFFSKTYPR